MTPPKVVYLKPRRQIVPVPTSHPRQTLRDSRESGPPASKKPEVDPERPIAAAHAALRDRLTEKHGAFWLDGLPASLDQVMLTANRIRKEMGLKPVGKKQEWLEC
jgi:hypothetical protein